MTWDQFALCAQSDPDLHHPTETGGKWQVAEAKKMCAACPVVRECLADAPDWDHWSVRGGLTGRERQKLRGRR